jgi:signal peptidase II
VPTLLSNYRSSRGAHRDIIAVVLYILGMIALVGADQLTKHWVVSYLSKVFTMPVIGDFIRFTYISNNGAAFNIMSGQRVFLIVVPALLSLVCIGVIVSRRLDSVLGDISLMLISAGGFGNLIDRAVRGYVVDFIDFNAIHFAVFNVADSCVTIGVILLVLYVILREGNFGRRKQKSGIFTRRRF